ncbi:DUF2637 domain-containing protein [Actinomadura sp. WMMB 499]|uniref:DUF2637 domain-containing protein n=1 Tax=Actinomadura sp. WMMB 499 TaxID=1219491 RepID=UPI00159E4189|nr:DUF2637 domain-containing protein [Actinomadura sp. WMMB 499]
MTSNQPPAPVPEPQTPKPDDEVAEAAPSDGMRATVVKAVAAVVAPLAVALAILGGVGSFATVREMAEPHFGELAWIVPVGMDVGILILLAWDLLMEYLDLPWPVLRWVAWAYIAGTVLVNIAAAGGDLAGSVMNAAMPMLFITVVEGVRHLIRRWVGLSSVRRVERVPPARWMLAPVSSLLLWRRMVLWHITGYQQGLELEYRHLLAVSELKQQYGRWTWRWQAPLTERLSLRQLPDELVTGPSDEEKTSEDDAPDGDDLMDLARQLYRETQRTGVRFTRDRLGLYLRKRGITIANDRLVEMIAAVRDEAAKRGSA